MNAIDPMRTLLLASVLGMACTATAQAAPVTETYMFSLGGFSDAHGSSAPPIPAVTGSFTLTFDPAVQVTNSTAGLSSVSVTGIGIASSYAYSYVPGSQLLSFGGSQNGPGAVQRGTSDLAVQIYLPTPDSPSLFDCSVGFSCGNFSGNGLYAASAYTLANSTTSYFASEGRSYVAVPEPAAFALLALPVGLAGLILTRRQGAAPA